MSDDSLDACKSNYKIKESELVGAVIIEEDKSRENQIETDS